MYKLILMDFSMPECSGVQATIAIRELLSNNYSSDQLKEHRPLICCLTAYSEPHYKVEAKKAGMALTLVKPIFKNSA